MASTVWPPRSTLPPPGDGFYDPSDQQDPLIARYITRSQTSGRPVFAGAVPYPVAAILQQLRVTGNDYVTVLESFPELSREALDAALHFWRLYGEEIRSQVELACTP